MLLAPAISQGINFQGVVMQCQPALWGLILAPWVTAGVADEAADSLATKLNKGGSRGGLPKHPNPGARDKASILNLTLLTKLQSADSQPHPPRHQKFISLSTLHEDVYPHYYHHVQGITRTKMKTCKWRCSWTKSPAPAISQGINLKGCPALHHHFAMQQRKKAFEVDYRHHHVLTQAIWFTALWVYCHRLWPRLVQGTEGWYSRIARLPPV